MLPVAAAFTFADGDAAVSADQAGDPEIAAPPAFTANVDAGGGVVPVPDTGIDTAFVPEWVTVTVADSAPVILGA